MINFLKMTGRINGYHSYMKCPLNWDKITYLVIITGDYKEVEHVYSQLEQHQQADVAIHFNLMQNKIRNITYLFSLREYENTRIKEWNIKIITKF